jgi:hypothetical protein
MGLCNSWMTSLCCSWITGWWTFLDNFLVYDWLHFLMNHLLMMLMHNLLMMLDDNRFMMLMDNLSMMFLDYRLLHLSLNSGFLCVLNNFRLLFIGFDLGFLLLSDYFRLLKWFFDDRLFHGAFDHHWLARHVSFQQFFLCQFFSLLLHGITWMI